VTKGHILVGVIGRPHGVRGLVRVTSYTADPAALADYDPLYDEADGRYRLAWRGAGIAALALWREGGWREIRDRDQAARLTNRRLYLDRATLPPPAAEEFYLADLIGLAAMLPEGAVGEVAAVHDYGAGASLEIARPGAAPLLVPFTREAVPEIDLDGGHLVVIPPHEREAPPPRKEAGA
jgi:16S rRNA processing protein RimM